MVVPQSICSYLTRTRAPVNVNIAQARPAGYGADECFEVNSVGLGVPRVRALYTKHRHVRVTRFNSAALSGSACAASSLCILQHLVIVTALLMNVDHRLLSSSCSNTLANFTTLRLPFFQDHLVSVPVPLYHESQFILPHLLRLARHGLHGR